MKIEKLYTLSQFIDKITAKIKAEGVGRFVDNNLELIQDYNELLKQPLKKDMFVNPIDRPIRCEYPNHFKPWQEAEKKVIFKDWIQQDEDYFVLAEKKKRTTSLVFEDDNEVSFQIYEENYGIDVIITDLYALAKCTKGSLLLKNVEL